MLDKNSSTQNISGYFQLEPVGSKLADLETPVPVIDVRIAHRNLVRWQEHCDKQGLKNRPHIKTHKLAGFAKLQLALGAHGVTVQKLGEAEAMAAHGVSDMLLTFNVVGESKLRRLAALNSRADMKVVADSEMVVRGLQKAAQASGKALSVFVECDTGMGRNGVQSPAAATSLANLIAQTDGLHFDGLMTYPKVGLRREAQAFLAKAKRAIFAEGLDVPVVTSGGTPDMWKDDDLEGIDEYRVGTYIYNDRSLVERGVCGFEDCALTVLSTVVSRPIPNRAMIDAGSKALTSDLLGLTGYGVARESNFSRVYDVSEEHGFLDVSAMPNALQVGNQVRIVPNHVCPVSNLFDKVVLIDGERVLGAVRVDARGAVT
jgi:D-serine deaminase-like pyridoxal phosphate-dependent protein